MINNIGAMQYSLMNSNAAMQMGAIADSRINLSENCDKMSAQDVFIADKKLDQEQGTARTRYLISEAMEEAAKKKADKGFKPYYG